MPRKSDEPYLSTYLHRKGHKLGIPVSGNFELTARCNFNCPMCYVHLTPEQLKASGKEELTAQQWLDIAKQARDSGMVFALLTGGEPLVRKDFFEIYDGMRNMGILMSVNSNGSMIKGEVLERFLQAPPVRLNISLYGGCNETYRRMCGIPVYEDVKENIRALRKAGVDVALNLSITQYNRMDLEQIYADAVELDVNIRAASYMYPSVRVNGEQYGCGNRLSAEESAACAVEWDLIRLPEEIFAQRAENMAHMINAEQEGCPVEIGEGVSCRAGRTTFWITWDGRMIPCGMMTKVETYPMETGFENAWQQLREKSAQIRLPAKCVGCSYKEVCCVCASVCQTETGRFDAAPEYVCKRTQEQVRLTAKAYAERKQK